MPHDHVHIDAEGGDRRIALAVIVNLGLSVAQIIGGILSGSLSLIADAIHNLSDAISLIIAFGARKIARRPADASMTYGYARAETVAALINYTTLIVIALYLVYEGVTRFLDPQGVDGWLVVFIAAIALVVDIITALLTWRMAKDSMNIRAAFLHNLADALGSVAVIVAGTLIILYGWNIVDPIATLLIAAYILWHASREIGDVIRVLMQGAPHSVSAEQALETIQNVDGVNNVFHLHLWMMDEHVPTLEAHVTIDEGRWKDADAIKDQLKAALGEIGITHSTVEMECHRHRTLNPSQIGHAAPHRH